MSSVQRALGASRRWPIPEALASVRGRLVAGSALFLVILVVVAGASAWETHAHKATLDELQAHSNTASLLQQSEAEVGIAALLVQRYVDTGDASYILEIQTHADAGVGSLTQAVSGTSMVDLSSTAVTGATLAQDASAVIAFKQAGNDKAAADAMEQIVPKFRQFRLDLEGAASAELRQVSSLRDSADRSVNVALWLLVVSAVIGVGVGITAAFVIGRSIISPLSRLENTARLVKEGDLSTRAPLNGPVELAHLGSTVNDMLDVVERHTRELRDANETLNERNRQLTNARSLAATDPLTGLGNHRAFHDRIREEIGRIPADREALGLVIFDIDEFKGFNDSLGHLAGDEILRRIGHVMRETVCAQDVYRYGGDEFALLLPGADSRGAIACAERLRVAFGGITSEDGRNVTVSLGIASFPEMATSAEELIYRADMAMYWAKSTGKNRVGDWDGLLTRRDNEPGTEHVPSRDGKLRDAVASLVSALAAKDPMTRDHAERCSWYTAGLARELGLDDKDAADTKLASLLHDIGKLAVPPDVLAKPAALNGEEWEQIKQHPTTARHILSTIESVGGALPGIVHHHEHFNGSGYPDGLAGESIPIASRIIAVADAFDAMITDRPYRSAMTVQAATEELRRHSGTQFDPTVVEAFLRLIARDGIHPLRQRPGEATVTTV